MDTSILKKRLNTFRSSKGYFTKISDEVTIEVLRVWEQWPGTTADLYRDLGIKKGQMSSIIRKAKKLVKNGMVPDIDFKEIEIEKIESTPSGNCGIELVWDNNKIIRFGSPELLVDFLKKAA